jgi:hypothetical protein
MYHLVDILLLVTIMYIPIRPSRRDSDPDEIEDSED